MKKGLAFSVFGICFFAFLFIFSEEFSEGIKTGLSNCAKAVIPSLFPFMVAATLTGYGELPEKLKRFLTPLTEFFFGLPADCFFAVITGQLGGYLSGAKAAETLFTSGKLTQSQTSRLIMFSVNAGMGFTVNAVGSVMLRSRESGRILLLSLVISSIILGFISKYFKSDEREIKRLAPKELSFSEAIVSSVSSAAVSTLFACAFVTVFSGISSVTESLIKSESISLAVSCILEVTNGCFDASGKISLPLIAAVCAFGGICVHMQVFSIAKETKINVPRFYFFRVIHSAIAYLTCKTILYFFPVEQSVFLSFSNNAALWSFSAPASVSLLFLSALLILDLDNKERIW